MVTVKTWVIFIDTPVPIYALECHDCGWLQTWYDSRSSLWLRLIHVGSCALAGTLT